MCQDETKVTNSREADYGRAIKRRRVCGTCRKRFTTYERVELVGLEVVKRDGKKEAFSRHKLELGLRKALEKRQFTEDHFQKLISRIESEIFNREKESIASEEIGKLVLSHLRNFDKVAYIRFASVYRNFKTPKAFEKEIQRLEKA